MVLNQTEKNNIYYSLEAKISQRLKELALDVNGHHMDYVREVLGEILDDVDLLDKLGKDGWALFEEME